MRTFLFLASVLSTVSCATVPVPGKASDYVVVTPPGPDWEVKAEKVYYTDRDPRYVVTLYILKTETDVEVTVYPKEKNPGRLAEVEAARLRQKRPGYRQSEEPYGFGPVSQPLYSGFVYSYRKEGANHPYAGMVLVVPLPEADNGVVVISGAGSDEKITRLVTTYVALALKPKR